MNKKIVVEVVVACAEDFEAPMISMATLVDEGRLEAINASEFSYQIDLSDYSAFLNECDALVMDLGMKVIDVNIAQKHILDSDVVAITNYINTSQSWEYRAMFNSVINKISQMNIEIEALVMTVDDYKKKLDMYETFFTQKELTPNIFAVVNEICEEIGMDDMSHLLQKPTIH